MAVEKQLGTESDISIKKQGSAVTIQPEESRSDKIKQAAEILVNEEQVLIDSEMVDEPEPLQDFNMNLVDVLEENVLQKISHDLLSSIRSDKESRSEWERTYTDGLKYLGM